MNPEGVRALQAQKQKDPLNGGLSFVASEVSGFKT